MWKHRSQRTRFCLCVNDFGLKYYTRDDGNHFLKALGNSYQYLVDWPGTNYCGLTFDWHYEEGYVDAAMLTYVQKAPKRLNYQPKTPQLSPHHHNPIRYTPKGTQQFASDSDATPLLPPTERRYLQSIVGTLLYYGRTVDYTILPVLNVISREQSKLTTKTLERARRLLDYVATYPDTHLR